MWYVYVYMRVVPTTFVYVCIRIWCTCVYVCISMNTSGTCVYGTAFAVFASVYECMYGCIYVCYEVCATA